MHGAVVPRVRPYAGAVNQALAAFFGAGDERTPYAYVLRVLGFVLILFAIVDTNLSSSRKPRQPRSSQ